MADEGRQGLDELIAKHITHEAGAYSSDQIAVLKVIAAMCERGYLLCVTEGEPGYIVVAFAPEVTHTYHRKAEDFPYLVCMAALDALGSHDWDERRWPEDQVKTLEEQNAIAEDFQDWQWRGR